MEKYVIFGPLIVFFGFFGLLVLGFFILVGKLFMQGKNSSWQGEVVDKSDFAKKDDDNKVQHILSLKVKLDNGETHSIPATADFYNKIKVGDRLEKKKGELWPKKI